MREEQVMAKAKRRTRYADDGSEIENGNDMEVGVMNGEEGAEELEHAAHETADMGRQAFRRIQQSALEPFEVFGTPMARLMDQNWSIFQKMMHVMREESLHKDPTTAVIDGYTGSAKVVGSAAIIMISVFASFILSRFVPSQMPVPSPDPPAGGCFTDSRFLG